MPHRTKMTTPSYFKRSSIILHDSESHTNQFTVTANKDNVVFQCDGIPGNFTFNRVIKSSDIYGLDNAPDGLNDKLAGYSKNLLNITRTVKDCKEWITQLQSTLDAQLLNSGGNVKYEEFETKYNDLVSETASNRDVIASLKNNLNVTNTSIQNKLTTLQTIVDTVDDKCNKNLDDLNIIETGKLRETISQLELDVNHNREAYDQLGKLVESIQKNDRDIVIWKDEFTRQILLILSTMENNRTRFGQLESDISDLKDDLKEDNNEDNEISTQLIRLDSTVNDTIKTNLKLEAAVSSLKKHVGYVRSESPLQDQLLTLGSIVDVIKTEISDYQSMVDKLNIQVGSRDVNGGVSLHDQVSELQLITKSQTEFNGVLQSKIEEISDNKERLELLNGEIVNIGVGVKECGDANISLWNAVHNIKNDSMPMITQELKLFVSSEIARIQNGYINLERTMNELLKDGVVNNDSEIKSLHELVNGLTTVVNQNTSSNSVFSTSIEVLKKHIGYANNSVPLQTQVTLLESTVNNNSETNIKLEEDIFSLKKGIGYVSSDVPLQTQVTLLDSIVNNTIKTNVKLEEDIFSLKRGVGYVNSELPLQEQLLRVKSTVEGNHTSISELDGVVNELKRGVGNVRSNVPLQEQISKLEVDLHKNISENDDILKLQSDLSGLVSTVAPIQGDVSTMSSKISALERDNGEMSKRISTLENIIRDLLDPNNI